MSCYHPRKAYPIEGGITFEKPTWHSGAAIKIPCKICIGCRLDHRSNWANRMMHEASLHEHNQFSTFTYTDSDLPPNGDLDQVHMQKFFKRLRKEFAPNKIRYVYSGEYGTKYSRPHYHAILFGLELNDLIQKQVNDRGEPLYSSAILDRIWGKGITTTGAVTPQSCGYVAGYMLKDIKGNYKKTDPETGKSLPYFSINTETGEYTERKRPFARYSNRPAIGKNWFEKYPESCFPRDFIITAKLDRVSVPPYYFDLLKKSDPEMHASILAKRNKAIDDPKVRWNSTAPRLETREICKKAELKKYARGSKHDDPQFGFASHD